MDLNSGFCCTGCKTLPWSAGVCASTGALDQLQDPSTIPEVGHGSCLFCAHLIHAKEEALAQQHGAGSLCSLLP